MKQITAQRLREVLSYDAESGVFTWTKTVSQTAKAGSIAGHAHSSGYRRITVDGCVMLAHRLAFLYMTGEWPSSEVDHINGDGLDNRMANLRDVPHATNAQNIRTAKSGRKYAGALGVEKRGERWRAVIWHRGKNRSLGTYGTSDEAHAAYLSAKRALHAGCTI